MWKDFFYFSRTERQGIILLVALIILVCAIPWFIPAKDIPPDRNTSREFEKEYADFLSSIKEQKRQRRENLSKSSYQKREIILTPFDPNTADSVAFLRLGLAAWMAGNILRYRNKGGAFRRPEDFRKIYGLTDEQYSTLLPYIHISETFPPKDTIRLLTREATTDTLRNYKYPEGTVIALNTADTTELKKIPGIGSGIARMIVGYRKRLGGFYRIEQLQEIHLSVDKLRSWLSVDGTGTQKMNLNKASIERLRAHPYINFYQAKVIVEYRKKKGSLKTLSQLKLYEEFSETDIERITPYICFN